MPCEAVNEIAKVEIPVDTYKELIELRVRRKMLEEYVNGEKYSLDKNQIRAIMELKSPEEEDV